MSIGDYRHVVTVQGPLGQPVSDGDGGYTQAPTSLNPATWRCSIEPATARDLERIAPGTVIATASHILTGHYHPQITTATQIVFVDEQFGVTHTFSVTGVSNPGMRNITTIAVCVELLN